MKREKYFVVLLLFIIPQILVFINLIQVKDDGIDQQIFGESKQSTVFQDEFEESEVVMFQKRFIHEEDASRRSRKRSVVGGLFGIEMRSNTRAVVNPRNRKVESMWASRLKNMTHSLFLDEMGPPSDSVCQLPNLTAPSPMCRDGIGWECNMVPSFSTYNSSTRNISVNCKGRFRVNQIDRLESEYTITRGSYRRPAVWKYYEGPTEIPMETEYADIVCKNKKSRNLHNYHTQFLSKPATDQEQEQRLQEVKSQEPVWEPLSILTIALDSTSRAQAHRSCGLPKTMEVLKRLYNGYFEDNSNPGHDSLSHQSFFFNRFNSISSSTALNLTPLFSGELYEGLDLEKVTKGIYAKDVKEWIWKYASDRGYITSYGIDNNSGMMGTRTHCKDCHYRPPVLAHVEHGWQKRENEEVKPNILSGLCDGNHMLHEYILNYTRDFLRHPHQAKWAALDLNAAHRRETESGNQVDTELASFLEVVLQENKNLVVFVLGDHGKPLHKDPSHLASYYETLLPFLSVVMPTWLLQEQPQVMANLISNQQRYLVQADLHLSMKSLLHYPYMERVDGVVASKAVNIFTKEIPSHRSCEQANIPAWTCVCGFMQKLPESDWTPRHTSMVQYTLDYINKMHSPEMLASKTTSITEESSCIDLHFRRILSVVVNENKEESLHSARRFVHHLSFQTIEEDTVWSVIMGNQMDIKQVKQITLYQPYDVCWDRRVPLQFCVCIKPSQQAPTILHQPPVR
ncbi:uncharacterized protein [Asterias amurensis]|uniref:uncharacterized protein n=1 Tax=Asterias amurensis TaxID=7602 RepID=UPI003AB8D87C